MFTNTPLLTDLEREALAPHFDLSFLNHKGSRTEQAKQLEAIKRIWNSRALELLDSTVLAEKPLDFQQTYGIRVLPHSCVTFPTFINNPLKLPHEDVAKTDFQKRVANLHQERLSGNLTLKEANERLARIFIEALNIKKL